MSSNFQTRTRLGLDRAHAHTSVAITYRRGARQVSITATPASTELEVVANDGTATRRRVRDYKIDVADLVFDGEQLEPRSGDVIVETIAGDDVTFEVFEPAEGESSWRFADSDRTRARIHTREVETC
jgi:hypothetical protein